jgi:hypothetical protein
LYSNPEYFRKAVFVKEINRSFDQHGRGQFDISSTNTDLVIGNCLDASNTLSTNRLTENEHPIFDLIGAEVSR